MAKKRVVTRIGDVFVVRLEDKTAKYFQYVANDLTQLNSDVIRAFKERYPAEARPEPAEVVEGEVEFYAHTTVSLGVKFDLWEKVGRAAEVGRVEAWFRGTSDYGVRAGEEPVKVSERWFVWKINRPRREVGRLRDEHREAEIGIVFNPWDIVHRIKTGEYGGSYPGFE